MLKHKRETKTKGFRWIIISIATIAVFLGAMLFGFDTLSIFNQEEQMEAKNSENSSETKTEKEGDAEDTETEQDYQVIQKLVANMHNFYNETTGYGEIEQLDWDEQMENAQEIIETIDGEMDEITSDALAEDLDQVVYLAEQVVNEQDSSQVRELHRYFHDLDIALNDYSAYDQIWNVTETLNEN